MSGFSALLDDLDAAVEDHLCDDAVFLSASGDLVPARVMLDHPRPADRLSGLAFARARPVMKVARAAFPDLKEGDRFQMVLSSGVLGDVWSAAEAPAADGDGRWWAFEVQPG